MIERRWIRYRPNAHGARWIYELFPSSIPLDEIDRRINEESWSQHQRGVLVQEAQEVPVAVMEESLNRIRTQIDDLIELRETIKARMNTARGTLPPTRPWR